MTSRKPRVVVVGAGFAGLRAVRQLARTDVEILLIDRNNYHTFIPLLYQVATGFIAPEQIAYPLRRVLRRIPNARFLMAEANRVNFDRRVVETDVTNVEYDYLVMATGARTRFLGVEGAARYSFGLNTLKDAVRLREQILCCFERAEHQSNLDITRQLLTFVIVGGGPTGVELAGALVDWVEGTLCRNYSISAPVRVILLQSRDRLLANFPEGLSDYSARQLRRRGVRVHFKTRVRSVAPTGVTLEDGTIVETATVIWTAGVEAHQPNTTAEVPTATQNKVVVRSTLQFPEYPCAYGVGDLAYVTQDGEPLVGVAPEALQQGTTVAANIKRQLQGRAPLTFDYFDKGRAAIIARNAGVAYLFNKISIRGFLAWLLWLGIHLYYLPCFSNRWLVFVSWIRDYFTNYRAVLHIFGLKNIIYLTSLKD